MKEILGRRNCEKRRPFPQEVASPVEQLAEREGGLCLSSGAAKAELKHEGDAQADKAADDAAIDPPFPINRS